MQITQSKCKCNCQSPGDTQQSQGWVFPAVAALGTLVVCSYVPNWTAEPHSPDSRSRRTLQVTFTCDKCGNVLVLVSRVHVPLLFSRVTVISSVMET